MNNTISIGGKRRSICLGYTALFFLQTTVFSQSATELFIPWLWMLGLALDIVFVLYFLVSQKITKNKLYILLSLTPLLFWLIDVLAPATGSTFNSILPISTIVLFCISDDIIKRETFKVVRILLIIESVFGILSFLLFITGILPPFTVVDFYEEGSTNLYMNYYFSVLYVTPNETLCRLCGLFNEPGWLGTICALCLIADGVNFRRIGNILIFIAGVLSLSLAFWLLLFIYFLSYSIGEKKFIYLVGLTVLVVVLALGAVTFFNENESITRFLGRFTFENGSFAGDDRTSDEFMKVWREVKNDSTKMFLGVDHYAGDMSTSSYLQYIVNYGIIGASFFLVPFIIISFIIARKNRYSLYLLLCFLASTYQRPQVFTLAYFIVLFGGFEYIFFYRNIH